MSELLLTHGEQMRNYLAIKLLNLFGNTEPLQKQIDLVEDLLKGIATEYKLSFDHRLTKREVACLFLAAQGQSSTETADLLKLKKTTVESHRRKIKAKLCSRNMTQAVFLGMRYGYLSSNQHSKKD